VSDDEDRLSGSYCNSQNSSLRLDSTSSVTSRKNSFRFRSKSRAR